MLLLISQSAPPPFLRVFLRLSWIANYVYGVIVTFLALTLFVLGGLIFGFTFYTEPTPLAWLILYVLWIFNMVGFSFVLQALFNKVRWVASVRWVESVRWENGWEDMMGEWEDGRMGGWVGGWVGEWEDGRMGGRMGGWEDGRIGEWVDGRMGGW